MSARPEGLLLLDKPAGMTSHDVVQLVRRAYGEKSIGHLGTLDPFATGLLVLLLGRVTRLANFIETEPKIYEATIQFGTETDTDDYTGQVVREAAPPSLDNIRAAILTLTGEISQVPPAYSAKSVGGMRAYDAARLGEPLTLLPAAVKVDGWLIRDARPDAIDVEITCGSGTYVRALARDLGRATHSAAHLVRLRRTRSGPFCLNDAASIDDIRSSPPPLRQLSVVVAHA